MISKETEQFSEDTWQSRRAEFVLGLELDPSTHTEFIGGLKEYGGLRQVFDALEIDYPDLHKGLIRNLSLLYQQDERYRKALPEASRGKYEGTIGHTDRVVTSLWEKHDLFPELRAAGIPWMVLAVAAVSHDVGKLGIPDCVLFDKTSWGEFQEIYQARLARKDAFSTKRAVGIGDDKPNYRDLVSLDSVFEGRDDALGDMQESGIDTANTSFMEILQVHQKISEEVVRQLKGLKDDTRKKVAMLVGSHHDYGQEPRSDIPVEVMRVAVKACELLRTADIFSALVEARTYKEGKSILEALYILTKEVMQPGVSDSRCDVTCRWVQSYFDDDSNGQTLRQEASDGGVGAEKINEMIVYLKGRLGGKCKLLRAA